MRRQQADKAVRAPEKSSRRTMIPRDYSAKRQSRKGHRNFDRESSHVMRELPDALLRISLQPLLRLERFAPWR
jgi:hypothetical protein